MLGRALPHAEGRRTEVLRLSTLSVRFCGSPGVHVSHTWPNQEQTSNPSAARLHNPIISPLAALSAQVLSTSVQNIIKTISMRSCGVKLS